MAEAQGVLTREPPYAAPSAAAFAAGAAWDRLDDDATSAAAAEEASAAEPESHSELEAAIAREIHLRGAPEVPPDVAQMGAVGQARGPPPAFACPLGNMGHCRALAPPGISTAGQGAARGARTPRLGPCAKARASFGGRRARVAAVECLRERRHRRYCAQAFFSI